jgi:alanine racemase
MAVEQRTRRPGIADVARAAGVSKTAVSFAFNRPERLRPETATRIREVAETLGYRPHPVARMLSRRQTQTVGILTPQALSVIFSNPFFGAFSEGAALAAEESGYGLHFVSPMHGSLSRAIGRAIVDGFVVIGLSADHPEVEEVHRSGLPVVLVDSTGLSGYASVEVDDEGGARAAAEHLLELGHRDLLILGVGSPELASPIDPGSVMGRRLAGYRAAIAQAGGSAVASLVVGPATIEGGLAAVSGAWREGRRPTGILAMSDAMAIGTLQAARNLGLSVPRDLSLVGFDDIDMARYTDPPLTTVHQPIRRKGEEAVRLLLSLVADGGSARTERRLLETRLIVRGSTAPRRPAS